MPKRKSDEQLEHEAELTRHREDEREPGSHGPAGSAGGGVHAAGSSGGGTSVGGLAGSNQGDGTPNADELEEAAGSGNFDAQLDHEDEPPYAGHAGGAVGGAPAGKRATGGNRGGSHGIAPEGSHRGDSTIGTDPHKKQAR